MLEQNIQMALSKQDINLEDAIDIREIKNLKLANQLLKVKRKSKQEADEKREMQKQAMISQQENALAFREGAREDAKKNRISQQNTEQSQLINQRKNNLPPKTFESNEDSMDGFDLAEFDPR